MKTARHLVDYLKSGGIEYVLAFLPDQLTLSSMSYMKSLV